MKVLLRDLGGGLPGEDIEGGPQGVTGTNSVAGGRKVTVELAAVPREGDELHWDNWIAKVWKTMWFPGAGAHGHVACCYVVKP